MLAAAHRVRRSSDFRTAFRGLRAARRRLVVHLAPGVPGQPGVRRVGFVVSRSVGGAVVRNVVQRRLRHLMRERLPHLPAGSIVVVRALPPAAAASSVELAKDLDAALVDLTDRLSRQEVAT